MRLVLKTCILNCLLTAFCSVSGQQYVVPVFCCKLCNENEKKKRKEKPEIHAIQMKGQRSVRIKQHTGTSLCRKYLGFLTFYGDFSCIHMITEVNVLQLLILKLKSVTCQYLEF